MPDLFNIYVTADQLAHALTSASLFVSKRKDNYYIPLRGVHVNVVGDRAEVVATDAFCLGLTTIEASAEGTAIPFTMPTDVVKRFAKGLAGQGSAPAVMTCTVEYDRVVSVRVDCMAWGEAHNLDDLGKYPAYRQLIPEPKPNDSTEGVGTMWVNPQFLAKFGRVKTAEADAPARLTFTAPMKPVRVDIGETCTGLIMPVRTPSWVTLPGPDRNC